VDGGLDHERAREQAMAPARLPGRGDEVADGLAVRRRAAVEGRRLDVARELHVPCGRVDVLHEAATDEIVLVADPGTSTAVGGEHQARVLDAPGGQHDRAAVHGERGPRQGLDAHRAQARGSGLEDQLGHVGVEHGGDGGIVQDALPIAAREVGLWAEPHQGVLEVLVGEGQPPRPRLRGGGGRVELVVAQLKQSGDVRAVGEKVGVIDRPPGPRGARR
jgi:hypothetical protein